MSEFFDKLMMLKMNRVKFSKKPSSLGLIIAGFAAVILTGAFLLTLPVASAERVETSFEDALFTATSATCVTGLIVQDTGTYWSLFGQIVVLALIQIGGFGVMTLTLFFFMLLGKKISLEQRQTIQNSISAHNIGGTLRLLKFVIKMVVFVELGGVLALLPFFCSRYGKEGIWMSIFHSVSAFCNGGFDILGSKTGKFSSLTAFGDSIYLTMVISLLIIIGGIGFLTAEDFITKGFHFRRYRMQSKIVLYVTAVLLVVPTLFLFFVDFADYPLKQRICISFFQTVTARTAGFNSVDTGAFKGTGLTVMCILMLIGGSPGSTAGGVKVTTFAASFANMLLLFKNKKHVACFRRRIDESAVAQASAIVWLYALLAITVAVIISATEKIDIGKCFFETFSAIGTVGITAGITTKLGNISHFLLIFLMFFGRVGGVSLITVAFAKKEAYETKDPVEYISIG